jgi:multiple sugar transport system substrate-binding protein
VSLRKLSTAAVSAILLLPLAAACTSDNKSDSGPVTLTYWASNQSSSLEKDKQLLQPELDKFKAQTGITVNVEVIGWDNLLNRILAATSSGQGPDILNIGNTWSASLQATGAFLPMDDANLTAVGGKDRILAGSLSATGAAGQPPVGVPLYSMAYGMYYNKKLFAEAGITKPPTTWTELVADGKLLTKPDKGQWGLVVEGANVSENNHHAFVFSQQFGGNFFDASGKPTFDSDANVAGIKRFLDFMAVDKIVNPSDAEYANNQSLSDFASGKAAILLWQSADASLAQYNMNPADYGVAPVPFESPAPTGGKHVNSMVAGINMTVFANTKHKDEALKFVKFMTSDDEQIILNKNFTSLPTVQGAYSDPAFQTPTAKLLKDTLGTTAAALPAVPEEAQFETLVGTAMKELWADIASGKTVGTAEIKAKLAAANKQVTPA